MVMAESFGYQVSQTIGQPATIPSAEDLSAVAGYLNIVGGK